MLRQRHERKSKLDLIAKANKKKVYVNNGNGTHSFGENILTLKNYKEPLKKIPRNLGFGWYGTLAASVDDGKIQCHVCGQFMEVLPGHIWNTHKMKVREYREKFGLAYTTALVSEQQRMKLKEKTLEWLKGMTPDELEDYKQGLRERGRKTGLSSRGTKGLTKTTEAMNKDGSCPDQTLDAIRKVKEEIGHVPSKRDFLEHTKSQRYIHLAYKHFGSWKKAIEMCKFGKDEVLIKSKGVIRKHYSDEELLEYLKIYAEEYQKIPTASDWKRDLLPRYDKYTERFGTIEAARQLAGVYNIISPNKTLLSRSKHYRKIYKQLAHV